MRRALPLGASGLLAILVLPASAAAQRLSTWARGGCLVGRDARVYCWGDNSNGLLGTPGAPPRLTTAAAVPGLIGVTQVSTANDHACALRSDGTVWCWGTNGFGQLGSGTPSPHPYAPNAVAPTAVSGLTNVTHIAASERLTCARLRDATLRCFGRNGPVSADSMSGNATPTPPPGLPSAASVYAGAEGMFVVGTDGTSYVWGANAYGQVSSATERFVAAPAHVASLSGVVAVDYTTGVVCVVHSGGGVSCWGDNESHLLGPGRDEQCIDAPGFGGPPARIPCRRTPQRIAGITDATDVAINGDAVVVRRRDGTLLAWGDNSRGSLLDPTAANRDVPAPVRGVTGVDEVSTNNGTLALCLRRGDRVQCWNAEARRFVAVVGLP